MSSEAPGLARYLVEWYRPELTAGQLNTAAAKLQECAAAMSGEGSPVQLLMTLAVPSDDVLFGVFAAGSADSVAQTCLRAGFPAERLSTALDGRTPANRRETPYAPAATPPIASNPANSQGSASGR